jgi:hypothetical protein
MSKPKPKDGEVAAEWVEASSLVPWEGNPRINDHAVEKVAASIVEFGWAEVIVARRADSMVISGHTRLKAAQKLGMTRVPVRFLDVDDRQARKLALAANKLGELSVWDNDGLAKVLAELTAEYGDLDLTFDAEALGFSKLEIDALLRSPGAWASEGAVDPGSIGDYDPAAETYVIKVLGIKAADRDATLDAVTAALAALGTGYVAKAF